MMGEFGTRRSRLGIGLAVIAFLALALLSSTTAYADTLNFSTTGCFSPGACSAGGTTASIPDLVTGLTDATIVFGGVASGSTTTGDDGVTLGTLDFNGPSAGSQVGVYVGTFSLDLTISALDGTPFTGGPFTALMTGNVFGNAGGATLTFNPITEAFTDGSETIDVTLDANPIQVSSSDPSATITAEFGADPASGDTNVPEPSTLLLSAVGFSGLFLLGRRRLVLS
jgi:hypothetical protein